MVGYSLCLNCIEGRKSVCLEATLDSVLSPILFILGEYKQHLNFLNTDRSSSRLQYAARMMKTFIQMLYLIHIIACAYYKISDYEGLNSNNFVYDGNGTSYIRCFYFATKTATSIGKLKPSTWAQCGV